MNPEHYMNIALAQARKAYELGEVPIGAVVVYHPHDAATRRETAPPQVIASACNMRETQHNPAGHAEFLAIEQAARHLGNWRLSQCIVYVTLEPCIMCAGLMQQARVAKCVYGAADPKGGALGTLYNINADVRLNHNFEVVNGVLEDECSQLLKQFFKSRRRKQKQ